MMTAGQLRAARALLGMDQKVLAELSGVSLPTIQRMEKLGMERSQAGNVERVQRALEDGGVEFIPENGGGVGVRLRDRST